MYLIEVRKSEDSAPFLLIAPDSESASEWVNEAQSRGLYVKQPWLVHMDERGLHKASNIMEFLTGSPFESKVYGV